MAIQEHEIKPGAIFAATLKEGNKNVQLRKVISITLDESGSKRVNYFSKGSGGPTKQKFNYGHTKAMPPKIESFIAACDHLLTKEEIFEYIKVGQINKDEVTTPAKLLIEVPTEEPVTLKIKLEYFDSQLASKYVGSLCAEKGKVIKDKDSIDHYIDSIIKDINANEPDFVHYKTNINNLDEFAVNLVRCIEIMK